MTNFPDKSHKTTQTTLSSINMSTRSTKFIRATNPVSTSTPTTTSTSTTTPAPIDNGND